MNTTILYILYIATYCNNVLFMNYVYIDMYTLQLCIIIT